MRGWPDVPTTFTMTVWVPTVAQAFEKMIRRDPTGEVSNRTVATRTPSIQIVAEPRAVDFGATTAIALAATTIVPEAPGLVVHLTDPPDAVELVARVQPDDHRHIVEFSWRRIELRASVAQALVLPALSVARTRNE